MVMHSEPVTPSRPLLGRQILALTQIVGAWCICGLALVYGPALGPRPSAFDVASRLAFVAHWLLVPGVSLLFCILVTMGVRFFSDEGFDGTRTPKSRFMEVNLRVTQNTLEQTVLALIAWPGLAIALAPEDLGIIPALALLFGLGRALFWAGYHVSPNARAIGFGLTAVPTAVALIWLALHAVT
jgi:hypothetical protein